jgi:uncharacterized protein YbjT (DUF2867 family)
MILIAGATGLVGGAVLQELLAAGVTPLRAVYRGTEDVARAPAGVDAVRADFADAASLDRALEGVRAAYLVCAAVPELVALESNFLAACQRARTPHVVLQSALGAADFDKSFPVWHRRVEERARELNVPCTILRPNGFMQNIGGYFAASIRTQDCFFDALGSARVSHIDVRDIATAAVRALTASDTIGRVFELSGPEPLSNEDLAGRISRVAGRPVRYVALTPEQLLQGMVAAGMPEARARPIVELYEYYRTGKGAGSDLALRELIGRAPRAIDAYLAEIAPSFAKPESAS